MVIDKVEIHEIAVAKNMNFTGLSFIDFVTKNSDG